MQNAGSDFQIHLLRTGDTDWDENKRMIGGADLPMSTNGTQTILDAIQSATFDIVPTCIITSPEEANQQVVGLLKARIHQPKIKELDSLCNVSLGLWEGTLETDLEERCPSTWGQWLGAPERIVAPDGESFEAAYDRIIGGLSKVLIKNKGGHRSIAIVLRPWAWVIVRSWLTEGRLYGIWDQLKQPNEVESFDLSSDQLRAAQSQLRTSA